MDMSKVNMHKRVAMTGNAPDVPAKAGHFRGGGIAKRGKGKALQEGGVFSDTVGRALGRRTPDAEGRALPRPRKSRGKKQGYKAREDESLGMRTGKESGKKQSMADRRAESYGKWGSRPDQRINRAKGGPVRGQKRQGRSAREDESLGMRTGKESGKKQSMKDRRDESYGKWRKPPQLRKGKKERRADYRKEVQKKGGNVIFADEWDKIDPGLLTGLGLKKGGAARRNTRRENILEEEGRVSAEKAYTKGGKRRLGAEKRRLVRELKK